MANNIENSDLNDIVSKVELLQIIECPVCQEIPFPPIYQCIRGHNVCKHCKPKLKHCPTCRGSLSEETRNFTVEQLVLASKHSCSYKEDGCRAELRGELMENHLKNCSYRPFKCPWFGQSNCSEDSLRLTLAKDHILQTHLIKANVGSTKTVGFWLPFSHLTGEGSLRQLKAPKLLWPPGAIEFDGKVFFPYTFSINQIISFVVLCVGSEEDAQKYRVKLICPPDKEMEIQWTSPVKSLVNGEELRNIENRCNVFVASCTLDDFIQMADINEVQLGYSLNICYTILKKKL